ncbi:MAG: metallophosphoesterase [Clostridia bacterium]|nr:metallophosphoesterase [Clostridia bacterium]
MTYVISDIHGEYEKYLSMLKLIEFSDNDDMYIIGDCIDRGDGSVKLLRDMSGRSNVFPIVGNHELMALDILDKLLVEITEENADSHLNTDTMMALAQWQSNGGGPTLAQFKALTSDERFLLLDYLKDFSPYEIIDVGERTFILVHSGLGNYRKGKKLREYSLQELCCIRPDYGIRYFDDNNVYIVSGHTPTLAITGKPEIYHNSNNILIDCGATFSGRLACLRLDDMKEFYV